jgi:hypothetical protein
MQASTIRDFDSAIIVPMFGYRGKNDVITGGKGGWKGNRNALQDLRPCEFRR